MRAVVVEYYDRIPERIRNNKIVRETVYRGEKLLNEAREHPVRTTIVIVVPGMAICAGVWYCLKAVQDFRTRIRLVRSAAA